MLSFDTVWELPLYQVNLSNVMDSGASAAGDPGGIREDGMASLSGDAGRV